MSQMPSSRLDSLKRLEVQDSQAAPSQTIRDNGGLVS
jgi:hypothetical protein